MTNSDPSYPSVQDALMAVIARGDEGALADLLERHPTLQREGRVRAYVPSGPKPDLAGAAREIVAREHHFEGWPDFEEHRRRWVDPSDPESFFEKAVEAVISGAADQLRALLAASPDLARRRSARRHASTLLHYVGANGVEGFRQRTPPNAVAIAEMLLDAGAEVNAEARMYGGGSTTLGLVATSIHPWMAGVQIPLLQCLLDHGAWIDQPGAAGNGQSVVNGCLANGRPDAAVFLASKGARLDLEGAAGVGRLDVVRQFFSPKHELVPPTTVEQWRSGFQWACEYGHVEVAAFLLDQGLDQNQRHRGQTGLHWAAYAGFVEVVELLLRRGASVEIADEQWQNSPLGWAMHGWQDPPPQWRARDYPAVAACLVGCGAVVRPEWIENARAVANPRMLAALMPGRVVETPSTDGLASP